MRTAWFISTSADTMTWKRVEYVWHVNRNRFNRDKLMISWICQSIITYQQPIISQTRLKSKNWMMIWVKFMKTLMIVMAVKLSLKIQEKNICSIMFMSSRVDRPILGMHFNGSLWISHKPKFGLSPWSSNTVWKRNLMTKIWLSNKNQPYKRLIKWSIKLIKVVNSRVKLISQMMVKMQLNSLMLKIKTVNMRKN